MGSICSLKDLGRGTEVFFFKATLDMLKPLNSVAPLNLDQHKQTGYTTYCQV